MAKNMNVENLKEKTAKGVEWGFIDNLGGTGILAVVNLVLARLLTPQEFGIVGMTSIFITLSTSLVDSGFTGALTRKATVADRSDQDSGPVPDSDGIEYRTESHIGPET